MPDPFFAPGVSEFGLLVTAQCGDCEGTGTAGHGCNCHDCLTCAGSGEVEIRDGEAAFSQTAECSL